MDCPPNLKNTGLNPLVVACQAKPTIMVKLNRLYLITL